MIDMDTIKDMDIISSKEDKNESSKDGETEVGGIYDRINTAILTVTKNLDCQDKNVWYDTTMVEHTNETTIIGDTIAIMQQGVLYCYQDKSVWYDTTKVEHTNDTSTRKVTQRIWSSTVLYNEGRPLPTLTIIVVVVDG